MRSLKEVVFFIIDWTWGFPQTLLGFILTHTIWQGAERERELSEKFSTVVSIGGVKKGRLYNYLSGFSLCRYICLHGKYYNNVLELERTIRHECGHSRQSRRLGWLYLLVVGIPSAINNLRSRVDDHVWKTYYQRYPESWADRLGGVERTNG